MIAIYIDAGHTTSGNPKRGWIITNPDGNFIDVVDEGYLGRAALTEAGYDCASTPRLEVANSVYQDLKRDANRHPSSLPKTTKKHSRLFAR